jgi:hypothetical protein
MRSPSKDLERLDAYLLAASSSQSKFPVEKQELYAGSSGETPFWRGISGLATMN